MSMFVTSALLQRVVIGTATALALLVNAAPAAAQVWGNMGPDVGAVSYDPMGNGPYREVLIWPETQTPVQAGTVSVDALRHPVSEKTRKRLRKALDTMDAGDHAAAIEQLRDILATQADAAIIAHNLLGIEYLRTDRFRAAAESFEAAARLLPHDGVTRHNLGLSLICAGEFTRGQKEVQRALELEPRNPTVQALHALLQKHTASSAE
ncbi:MAG: hypothetical protein ABL995_02775 [Bryobacteraceae bacterium]